jgi:hypothetical protein
MTPLGIFGKKKKVEKKEEKKGKTPKSSERSLLEELCGGDAELLSTLTHTILIDPSKLYEEGIDSFIGKAQDFEKQKEFLRARINYQAAGELALYEGKLAQVQKLFTKCSELESNVEYKKVFAYYSKKTNAEKALKVAQEYYAQIAKPMEKT